MNIEEAIDEGKYESKVPYPEYIYQPDCPVWRRAMEAHKGGILAALDLFWADVAREHGVPEGPFLTAMREAAWLLGDNSYHDAYAAFQELLPLHSLYLAALQRRPL